MKHIKLFEEINKIKAGDYVRFINGKFIYQVLCQDNTGFYLEDTLELNGYKQPDQFWIKPEELELVPEYELDAIKYNL